MEVTPGVLSVFDKMDEIVENEDGSVSHKIYKPKMALLALLSVWKRSMIGKRRMLQDSSATWELDYHPISFISPKVKAPKEPLLASTCGQMISERTVVLLALKEFSFRSTSIKTSRVTPHFGTQLETLFNSKRTRWKSPRWRTPK